MQFGCSPVTISNVNHKKEAISKQWEENLSETRVHVCNKGHVELKNIVWDFFCSCRAKNLPVTGPLLQEKAIQLAESLHIKDLKASNK